jgi:hypothetical protein
MEGTERIRDVCAKNQDKNLKEYLKFFYEMQDGINKGLSFRDYGSTYHNKISASDIKVLIKNRILFHILE